MFPGLTGTCFNSLLTDTSNSLALLEKMSNSLISKTLHVVLLKIQLRFTLATWKFRLIPIAQSSLILFCSQNDFTIPGLHNLQGIFWR